MGAVSSSAWHGSELVAASNVRCASEIAPDSTPTEGVLIVALGGTGSGAPASHSVAKAAVEFAICSQFATMAASDRAARSARSEEPCTSDCICDRTPECISQWKSARSVRDAVAFAPARKPRAPRQPR
eukprot:6196865-Pleurochrysis_carterae.AAC.3